MIIKAHEKELAMVEREIGQLQSLRSKLLSKRDHLARPGQMPEGFKVEPIHRKLLARINWDWWECEFGAPAVDCKRPYGNSDVYRDIGKALGWEPEAVRPALLSRYWSDDQVEAMNRLHCEMLWVLELICKQAAGINSGE